MQAAYRQWLASPLRVKQGPELQGLADGEGKTMMFRSVHAASKPPASGTLQGVDPDERDRSRKVSTLQSDVLTTAGDAV